MDVRRFLGVVHVAGPHSNKTGELCRTRRLKTPINFSPINMGTGNPVTSQSCQMPSSCNLGVTKLVMRQLESDNILGENPALDKNERKKKQEEKSFSFCQLYDSSPYDYHFFFIGLIVVANRKLKVVSHYPRYIFIPFSL